MSTKEDITIAGDDFVALSTITGEAMGTAMEIQVKSTNPLLLREVVAKPDATSKSGKVLTNMNENYAVATITAGSGEVWLRCYKENSTTVISVELI